MEKGFLKSRTPWQLFPARRCAFRGFQRIDPYLNQIQFRFSMGGKITQSQSPFGLGISIGLAILCAVFLNNSITTFTLLCNRLKRTTCIFCGFTGLHNANLLKKYHFSLESRKKFPYNTINYIPVVFHDRMKLVFIKGILTTVNIIS